MTVKEHLDLYATLKGVPAEEKDGVVTQMMKDVGIPEKAHSLSRVLSGGMKRKLSVGCALIGGSRAVLLDEPSSGMAPASLLPTTDYLLPCTDYLPPTTYYLLLATYYLGMDPSSRRGMWELLRSAKQVSSN